MAKCYFELRKRAARGTDSLAADMMRHLHTRQHLGKAVIICEQPSILLPAARKQWLKLSRAVQKQRASTLNADKILKYTHTIAHMQHMRFTAKTPLEDPSADVYFLRGTAKTMATMPAQCYTIYVTAAPSDDIASWLAQLPVEALIVDYDHRTPWPKFGLQSKVVLESQVASEWLQVERFLSSRNIAINRLVKDGVRNVEAMDDALDTLLAASNQFLVIADEFQRALELARPLRIPHKNRQGYDSLVLMAFRVQALSPGAFTQRFLHSYNEDDTFFFYDVARQRFIGTGEPLGEAVARHLAAGRKQLANSLQLTAMRHSAR